MAVLLAVLAPAFYAPLFEEPVRIMGLPPAASFFGTLIALVAANLLAVRFVRSTVAVWIVIVVTTTFGTFVAVLGPAIVLIAANMAL